MKLIDSHCHLNFSSFKDEYIKIIADCLEKEIGVINIGSQIDTSIRALKIANEYPNDPIYAVIGLHPIHLSSTEVDEEEVKFKSREEKFNEKAYQELLDEDENNKIVAIGEIGLDYWHIPEDMKFEEIKELQKNGLIPQLDFAKKNNLPVIFHARGSGNNPTDAYDDLYEIVKDMGLRGVVHSFDSRATKEIAKKFLDLGMYIGFNGVITFKNKTVDSLRDIVKLVPLDRILIETDAPYLTPEPNRGKKNEPQNVSFVARKIGEIKDFDFDVVAKTTTDNFRELFL
jgi:TatD DNase family protein